MSLVSIDDNEMLVDFYSFDEATQQEIVDSLRGFLERYGFSEILLPVYSCVVELVVNAVKANFKNLYFKDEILHKKSGSGSLSYSEILDLFRFEMKNKGTANFVSTAKEKDIKATLSASVEKDNRLVIRVKNPYPMTKVEVQNVRKRLDAVKKITALSEYFEIDDDESKFEGAGLGLVFVGLVLKNLNIPPENLTLRSRHNSTTAQIIIPLDGSTLEAYRHVGQREVVSLT